MASSRPTEIRLCGLAAVRARFQRDPASIKRLFFDLETGRKLGAICKELAATRRVYRCVTPAELEKIADSVHHGGVVAVAESPALRAPRPEEIRAWAKTRAPLLLLDRVGNAHNLGALARTAAFIGLEKFVLPLHPQQALPGEAAYRVSEGGLELVEIFQVKSLAAFCRELAPHYSVVGTAVQGAVPLDRVRAQLDPAKPVALVLGNEEQGLSREVAQVCTRLVTIPGTGKMESLNVSVAAAILMWELFG